MNTGKDQTRWQKRKDILAKRHLIKRALRDYLHAEGFIEVDVPLLVRGTTPDARIDSFTVDERYLSTSAEFQLKRMEIGGFERVYSLTQNFRKGDTGRYRNPEFTMLEWARVGASLEQIEQDLEQMIMRAHQSLGGNGQLLYQGRKVSLVAPFERLTVQEAVRRVTGYAVPDFSPQECRKAIESSGLNVGGAQDSDFLFSVLIDHVQAKLGMDRPVFLRDWPSYQTASSGDNTAASLAERSELVIAGVEISDGFPSLADPVAQKRNFDEQQKRRTLLGKEQVELDTAFLNALKEGFPAGAGMAMGLDRLVMLLTDQPDISATLAFSWDEL